jgi:hypothetical protein
LWLAANPLADIRHSRSIRGVMTRGRWYDRITLDRALAAIEQRHRPAAGRSGGQQSELP